MSSSIEILQGRQEAVLEEKGKERAPAQDQGSDTDADAEGTSDAESHSQAEDTNEDQNEEAGEGKEQKTEIETPSAASTPWQAIWSPQYGAYYFFNAATQETTWVNPLQPEASSSGAAAGSSSAGGEGSSGGLATAEGNVEPQEAQEETTEEGTSTGPKLSRVAAQVAAMRAAAEAQGIDPLLAHLDPTLMHSGVPGASGPSDLPVFKAQFNARTGQFAPMNSRTPGHLSEFERAKRMSEFYFDVNKWEEDLAKRGGRLMGEEGDGAGEGGEGAEGDGKKRKRPSKKDVQRFKEQKKQKKIAKTAWLRT